MKLVDMEVQGMSCGHCIQTIEKEVGQLHGVETVEVNLREGKVHVAFDEQKVALDTIKKAIQEAGYEVK